MLSVHKKKYESLGFVESMIAIMVVGFASVVLMRIAVNTLQNVIQNEAIDNMTQYAVEGAEIVQSIAHRDRVVEERIFPSVEVYGVGKNCFVFDLIQEENEENLALTVFQGDKVTKFYDELWFYSFKKDDDGNFLAFNKYEDREEYKEEKYRDRGVLKDHDEFFRLICLHPPIGSESLFVVAEIVVGQRHGSGTITKGNLVKDYEYRTIIRFLEKDELDPDSDAPVTTVNTPSTGEFHNEDIAIAGVTHDRYIVSEVILSWATYSTVTNQCSTFEEIIRLENENLVLPYIWDYEWTPEDDGTYCIRAQGVDQAGNIEDPVTVRNITYDTLPPVTEINSPVVGFSTNDSIGIEGKTEDSVGVSEVMVSYATYNLATGECQSFSDITTLESGSKGMEYNWSYNWQPSSDGRYCIRARGVDKAGNIEDGVILENILYDTTAPTVEITINEEYILTVVATDPLSGVDTIQVRIDGGSWLLYQEEINVSEMVNEEPGEYTLGVRVRDNVGNERTEEEDFTID